MATINLRGTSWVLNWSQGGKQHRESLGPISPHDAKVALHAKEVELRTGKRIFVAAPEFSAFVTTYLAWHKTEWPTSHYRIKQICDQHLGDFHGKALSQIEPLDVEKWKAKRLETFIDGELIARSTVAKELRTLKAVFNKAIEWKKIEESPAEHVDQPKNLEGAPPHWFPREELEELYKCYHGVVWRFMANTGLRRGEALQLRPKHVNLDGAYIDVCSTAQERTKSGKWRRIPLSPKGKDAAEALLAANEQFGYVVPHITPPSLSRAAAFDIEVLQLDGSLHSFRHSYGAHACMAGVPLRTLQKLMGHASIKTTEIYAHIADQHLKANGVLVNL